jgi:hypothetical protein
MIGGEASSKYLQRIQTHPEAQTFADQWDEILATHLIGALPSKARMI